MSSNACIRRTFPTLWGVCLLLSLAFLLGALLAKEIPGGRSEAATKDVPLPARFAIADFDGDQKPDLATVNVDRSNGRATNYSIHLHLSLGPESVIGITAPMGGLQIISRDVNGDRIMDLVVRTSLESNLVAVLLNDGHGKFTMAQAGAFPGLAKESEIYAVTAAYQSVDPISLLPPRSNAGAEAFRATTSRLQNIAEPLGRSDVEGFHSFVGRNSGGRSPPPYFLIFS